MKDINGCYCEWLLQKTHNEGVEDIANAIDWKDDANEFSHRKIIAVGF